MAKLDGLHPYVRAKTEELIRNSEARLKGDYTIRITQAFRSKEEQNNLYAQGRTQAQLNAVGLHHVKAQPSKPKVTNARGGFSMHNFGYAIDFCLISKDGKKVSWDMNADYDGDGKADWMEVVEEAKKLGFEWGGDWKSFKDYPHFQMTAGLTDRQVYNGAVPKFPDYKPSTSAPSSSGSNATVSKPVTSGGSSYVKQAQTFANTYASRANFSTIHVDGYHGPLTRKALTRTLQYLGGTAADGIWGVKTERAVKLVRHNDRGEWAKLLQACLNVNGYELAVDGIIGTKSIDALKDFQRKSKIAVDGIAGADTFKKLLS